MWRPIAGWLLLAAAFAAVAQENSGRISGTVTDSSGRVVPDARISVVAPAAPRPLEARTDGLGRYHYPRVPIGTYSVSAGKSGFKTTRQSGVEVKLGAEVTCNLELVVGVVEETLDVRAARVSLYATSARTSTNLNLAEFENLAKSRDYVSLLPAAPGLRLENRAGGGYGVQVDGASGSENIYVIDGVDVTDMFTGGLRRPYALPLQMVQEVQVKSGGFDAEYGGANGGVINIATRNGTDGWHGEASFQFTSDGLNPRPRGYWQRSPADADRADFFAQSKDGYRTLWPGGSLGGPLVRERLFFFGSYEPSLTRTDRSVAYPSGARTFRREETQHESLVRVDAHPAEAWRVNSSWLWAPERSKGALPNPDPRVPAPGNDQSILGGFVPSQSITASASYAVSERLLLSALYGYRYLNLKPASYGIPNVPWIRYVNSTSAVTGVPVPQEFAGPNGYQNVSDTFTAARNVQARHNGYADANWVGIIGGRHHSIKAGYAINRVKNDIADDYPAGRFDIYWGDSFTRGTYSNIRGLYGYYVWEDGIRHSAKVAGHNQGIYIQDSWRALPALTLNAGVRFENEFLPPYLKEQGGVRIANPVAFGWGEKIAPRLGAAWDIRGDGLWKLSASFGDVYDVMKYELARVSFGGDIWFSSVYRLDSPNVRLLSKASPGVLGAKILTFDNRRVPLAPSGGLDGIDPDLKPYKTRRFTLSLDRQLAGRMVAGVRYTHDRLLRTIEDIGVLDEDDNEVYLIGNPGGGRTRSDPRHIYDGKTPNGNQFLVPAAGRRYDAVEFRLQGRALESLQVIGSYTYSRLWGNYAGLANSDESGRSEPNASAAFNLPYYYFDASGDQKNKFGRLATDRPHSFKFFGAYGWNSRAGETNLGLNQFAASGTPDSTSVVYISAPTFPNGRGDMGRTPVLTQTDISLNHAFKTSERTRIRVEVNLLNAWNQAVVISRVTQINRASAINETKLPLASFFSGYRLADFVYPGSRTPPYNPVYGLPGGHYSLGGPGGYQAPRNVRFGVSFLF